MGDAAHEVRGVPKPNRLRVLCKDETCPVMKELVLLRRANRGVRLSLGVFLVAGGVAAAGLWWNAGRRV